MYEEGLPANDLWANSLQSLYEYNPIEKDELLYRKQKFGVSSYIALLCVYVLSYDICSYDVCNVGSYSYIYNTETPGDLLSRFPFVPLPKPR